MINAQFPNVSQNPRRWPMSRAPMYSKFKQNCIEKLEVYTGRRGMGDGRRVM
jgi:hypothetical protein